MIITLQPSRCVDHVTPDGTELTQRPYPFRVSEDGAILNQEYWQGSPNHVVGFVGDLRRHEVDVYWRHVVADPQRAVGMYLITADADGTWAVHVVAVESVTTS